MAVFFMPRPRLYGVVSGFNYIKEISFALSGFSLLKKITYDGDAK